MIMAAISCFNEYIHEQKHSGEEKAYDKQSKHVYPASIEHRRFREVAYFYLTQTKKAITFTTLTYCVKIL